MLPIKPLPIPSGGRGAPLRERVLDAAENLLRRENPDFSMRDLAAEAGVSFATPFNQFGSKLAIMRSLSARRIDAMTERFSKQPIQPNASSRVLLAVDVAAAVMVADPQVNRAVMGSIGAASPEPGQVLAQSTALWTLALAGGEGFDSASRDEALRELPEQLAIAFRGVLSFWTAGELSDASFTSNARQIANALLSRFVTAP